MCNDTLSFAKPIKYNTVPIKYNTVPIRYHTVPIKYYAVSIKYYTVPIKYYTSPIKYNTIRIKYNAAPIKHIGKKFYRENTGNLKIWKNTGKTQDMFMPSFQIYSIWVR